MGIKFLCPSGHKLHVKNFLAGKKAICPRCGARVTVPDASSGDDDGNETASVDITASGIVAAGQEASWQSLPAAQSSPEQNPLSDPGGVWYVRPADGGQFGPASSDIMRTWLTEGRVAAGSLVWREGWPSWRQANAVFRQVADPATPKQSRPAGAHGRGTSQTERTARRLDTPAGKYPFDGHGPATGEQEDRRAHAGLTQGLRRRKRQNDSSVMISAILAGVALVLVIVLVVVVNSQQTTDNQPQSDVPPPSTSDFAPR